MGFTQYDLQGPNLQEAAQQALHELDMAFYSALALRRQIWRREREAEQAGELLDTEIPLMGAASQQLRADLEAMAGQIVVEGERAEPPPVEA